MRREGPPDTKVASSGDVAQELGELGFIAPEVGDIVSPDAPVHSDTIGTAARELLDLSGSPGGGFLAVWRDGRDGNTGLYFARVAPDGEAREAERALYAVARSSRQLDPASALAPNGEGVFAWRDGSIADGSFFARFVHPDGALEPAQQTLGNGSGELTIDRSRARKPIQAAIAFPSATSAVATWSDAGNVWIENVAVKTGAQAAPAVISKAEGVDGRPLVASAKDGGWLVVWPAKHKIVFVAHDARGAETRGSLGDGAPVKLAFDPASSGWWMSVDLDQRRVLRRISPSHAVEGADAEPARAPETIVDFAPAAWGVAALVGPGGGRGARGGGIPRVVSLDAKGAPLERAPYEVRGVDGSVGNVRVSSSGDVVLIAWSETNAGEHTIMARTLSSSGDVGAVRKLNHDTASANQAQGDLASNGGDRAVCAWVDSRYGAPRVLARLLAARGGFASDELAIPAAIGAFKEEPAPAQKPAVAMDTSGRFLVAWSEDAGGGQRLRAQVFAADGKALAPPCVVDPALSEAAAASAAPLRDERGFVLAWTRGSSAVFTRRVGIDGQALGAPTQVSTEGEVGSPFVLPLEKQRANDPERFIVAWDVKLAALGRRLRARFLDAELAPDSVVHSFDTMHGGSDWDPHLAAGPNGGFAMSWTSGEDRTRDVFARLYDADAKPTSRPFAICYHANEQDNSSVARLKDGSFAVAWEDDISYYDFVYVRRIAADGKSIGPMLTLCDRPKEFMPEHVGPKIATVATGLAAVWGDTRRSKGFDTFWKVIGPNFDAHPGRPTSAKH